MTVPSATYHIPNTTIFNANSGRKGVIADAKSFGNVKKRIFRQTVRAYSNDELSPPTFRKSKKSALVFSFVRKAQARKHQLTIIRTMMCVPSGLAV